MTDLEPQAIVAAALAWASTDGADLQATFFGPPASAALSSGTPRSSDPLQLDSLDPRELVHVFGEVASTQDLAAELAARGAPHGTLVIADHQVRGRGRRGRGWVTPPGSAVLMSVVLRPRIEAGELPFLGMAASLAMADTVRDALRDVAGDAVSGAVSDVYVGIKWPNDVLAGPLREKIAGILLESAISGASGPQVAPPLLVAGLGLNVLAGADDLPEGATSLALLAGESAGPPNRGRIAGGLWGRLLERARRIEDGGSPVAEWRSRLATLGERVAIVQGDRTVEGTAVDVQPDGGLVVLEADGNRGIVYAGDVAFSREPL